MCIYVLLVSPPPPVFLTRRPNGGGAGGRPTGVPAAVGPRHEPLDTRGDEHCCCCSLYHSPKCFPLFVSAVVAVVVVVVIVVAGYSLLLLFPVVHGRRSCDCKQHPCVPQFPAERRFPEVFRKPSPCETKAQLKSSTTGKQCMTHPRSLFLSIQ